MSVTLIVEPDPGGHRFQAVANVAALAGRSGEVALLTSSGASTGPEFGVYLSDARLDVHEVYTGTYPPTRTMADEIARYCRAHDVSTVVVMDADQSLKRWWYAAPLAFRGLPRRPRVIFMLTRYPARLRLEDRFGWKLRLSKATLAVLAMATRSLDRVAGFAGREDMSRGWLVKRARDPAICTAHARDRSAIRAALDLPAERSLVGIFGVMSMRKNAPLILDAILASESDADLVIAGLVKPDVAAWLDGLAPEIRARITVRDGYLDNDLLDRLVAAVDVVIIALTNNGPSGIMGKALAAGVPVVSAGSEVRARELEATAGGESAELTVPSLAAAIHRVLDADPAHARRSSVPPATAEEFAAVLLGVDGAGRRAKLRQRG
jgi:glycosyltransferase involved in cell wall biosynthesis